MTDSDPTPTLDAFLAAYGEDDNEWWYLSAGDHLNLFDEAVERMRVAEARHAADAAADPLRRALDPATPEHEALVERLCEVQHDAYEAAAPAAGWQTQERSRKPWADVPEANKQTMRESVRAVLAALREREEADRG